MQVEERTAGIYHTHEQQTGPSRRHVQANMSGAESKVSRLSGKKRLGQIMKKGNYLTAGLQSSKTVFTYKDLLYYEEICTCKKSPFRYFDSLVSPLCGHDREHRGDRDGYPLLGAWLRGGAHLVDGGGVCGNVSGEIEKG